MNSTDIKANKTKCPVCGGDHPPRFTNFGTNRRGDITGNTLKTINKKRKKEGSSKITKTNHLFYRKQNKLKELKERLKKCKEELLTSFTSGNPEMSSELINKMVNASLHEKRFDFMSIPDAIQVHHLITVGAVGGGKNFDKDWYDIFYKYGYDINCAQNAIILPGDMISACHFKVPLHKGGHDGTFIKEKEIIVEKSYVTAVKEHIASIKTKYTNDKCADLTSDEIIKFHEKMLKKTNHIFDMVSGLIWFISSDGPHYHHSCNIGCFDLCRTIEGKQTVMEEALKRKKENNQSKQSFFVQIIGVVEDGCKGKRNRDHTDLGCENKTVNWTSDCRYNIIPTKEDLGLK